MTDIGGIKCWGGYPSIVPVEISAMTSGVGAIAVGNFHTCAMTTSGGAKCWGQNSYGQLGDGTTTTSNVPVDVSGMTSGVNMLAAGGYHTCAVTTSGEVKCWGRNTSGQVGDGTATNSSFPIDVSGMTSGVNTIAAGSSHTCAVTTSGGSKCWGSNTSGQLGDGTTTNSSVPIDISGMTSGVNSITVGGSHTCAVTTSGGAKCWGYNSSGGLGDGTTTNSSVPVDVFGMSSGVNTITAGGSHTCAVTTSGCAKCWGSNGDGTLGNGSTTNSSTPIDVLGMTAGVNAIATGTYHTCAATSSGAVKCWGANDDYQLGETPLVHTVRRSMTAHGTVNLSGAPLSGVLFRVTGMGPLYADLATTTDGGGNYSLAMVEDTSYKLTPVLAGYTFVPPYITATLLADTTQDFTAILLTYNITGNVTASSNPLSGATVDGGPLGTTTTDASGNYAFNAIAHGTAYTITVSHSGATFGVDTSSGTLNNHATHNFSGTLNTYDITGTITSGGNPLSGVAVNGGGLGNTNTDGSGAYSFLGVNYGTVYVITPSLADYDFSPVSAGATLVGNATHDFTGVYNPPTTTSVSTTSIATTSVTTTTVATTSMSTTTVSATTVGVSTVASSTTSVPLTSTIQTTSSEVSTTTVEGTTSQPTTIFTTTIIETATTAPPEDTDGDGLTDAEEEAQNTDPEDADSDDDSVIDGEEVQTGTNPNDPGSKAPKLHTTVCSDWNGYLGGQNGNGMYNIMEHINLTTKKIRLKTELRSIRGHLKNTYNFFLRGNQQFDLLVHDFSGREQNSYGQVCTSYTGAPAGSLDGRMVYYKFANDGRIQFAFALPFENPSRGSGVLLFNTKQPSSNPADVGNLVANWVQISNVSKKRLKGSLHFYTSTGAILGGYSVNLRDGARYDYSGHAWNNTSGDTFGTITPSGNAGLVRFVPADGFSDVDYQLRLIRYLYDNSCAADSFSTAYPFEAAFGSGETLAAPFDTSSATSSPTTSESAFAQRVFLELANTLNKKISVTIRVYDKAGKQLYNKTRKLPAYGSEHIQLDTLLLGSPGLVTAKGSHRASIIGSIVHYGQRADGSVENMFATNLREPVGTTQQGSYNTYLNQGCTLYLGNSSIAKQNVSLSLRQNDGSKPVPDYTISVPARGTVAADICAQSPKNVYGVVSATSAKPKTLSGVIVRNGEGYRYRMATQMR